MALRGGDVVAKALTEQRNEREQPKFALLAGNHYYPEGGWNDHIGTFESLDAAYDRYRQGKTYEYEGRFGRESGESFPYQWGHVVNLNSGNIVAKYY